MSLRLPRGHVAIRAFVHSSSRSCGANAAQYRQPERDRPRPETWAEVEDNAAGPSSPPTAMSSRAESMARAALKSAWKPAFAPTPRTMIYGNYIHCLLPDRRTGRLVTYIFPRPSFTLKVHPLAVHPCVSGLGLDHGTLSPVQPIDNYKVVRDKRSLQLAQARKLKEDEAWHCNLPPERLQEWASHWMDVLFDGEQGPPPEKYLEEYDQPITYVGINGQKAPPFARGRTSLLLTCLLPDYHHTDPRHDLNELGLPSHVTDLLLALPQGPFTHAMPELPTVTRISPAQYVLNFHSRKARNALYNAWEAYCAEVAASRGGCKPPYTMVPDKERAAAHDPAVDKAAHAIAAKARQHGLDVRLDAMGGLWLGDTRYARVEDLPKLIFERTGMPRPGSSTKGTVASKLASAQAKRPEKHVAPAKEKPPRPFQKIKELEHPAEPRPLPVYYPRGRSTPLNQRRAELLRDAKTWDLPPGLDKFLS